MKFLWIDLETTGLDYNKCSICEIAAIITDESLKEEAVFTRVVDSREAFWQAYPLTMHMDNGLLADMGSDKAKPWGMVGTEFYKFLMDNAEEDDEGKLKRFYLAGSSVHFDRRFLDVHWSFDLERHFSHRMLDVSAIKLAIRAVHGNEIANEYDELPEGGMRVADHRALADIRYSIELFKHFKQNDFNRNERI